MRRQPARRPPQSRGGREEIELAAAGVRLFLRLRKAATPVGRRNGPARPRSGLHLRQGFEDAGIRPLVDPDEMGQAETGRECYRRHGRHGQDGGGKGKRSHVDILGSMEVPRDPQAQRQIWEAISVF